MSATRHLTENRPNEGSAKASAEVVAKGGVGEAEAHRTGLRTLEEDDPAVENWLRENVVPAIDALRADPTRALSVSDVRATLAAARRQVTASLR